MTDALRQGLHGVWAAAAPAWGQHADFVDERGRPVAQAMIDAAELQRGDRVLELACGPGGLGIMAAELVGSEGEVVLSDIAKEMTAIARERAAAHGLKNVRTREVDMEQIDCPDASFDKVVCREGLMLVPDPAAAVREVHRVLVPGGRAAFAVWGPRERNPWLGVLVDAVSSRLGIPVPPPGIPGPFSLSGYGELEELLSAAGFRDVMVREVATPMNVSSFDEWWTLVPALAGPVAPLLAGQPDDRRAGIRADAEAALDGFRSVSGYELPGLTFVGVAHH